MIDACNLRELKPLLDACGFRFSKAKGQNFLTAPWVPQRIAEACALGAGTGVLEVGPGVGSLTQQLCAAAGKVCAVELDRRLEPVLAATTGEFDNLTLVFGDVLKQDIPALTEREFAGLRPVACANLPYYITTPVLTALLEARCFDAVTVMVQKEVAQRVAAAPGTPQYGAFSVFCQYYSEPRILFDVPPSCFVPQPKVLSAVISLPKRAQPWQVEDEALFFRVVRTGFAMRRKKLENGLAAAFPRLGKAGIGEIIAQCGLDENVRAEALGIPEFAALAREIGRS